MLAGRVAFVAFLAAVSFSLIASATPLRLRPERHVGGLNSRLTREQLQMKSLGDIQPQYLTQYLDHQDLSSTVTWQQKYYVNDAYFTPGSAGPVFFLLGGEGPVSPHYVTDHFITSQLAQQHNALLVALEHRFYGESIPTKDSSTANLKYLSSAQALADTVVFYEQIMKQYNLPAGTKWVVFGGSYSGNLSAWARLKYPHLYVGAFSASAPVRAELDFLQYFEVVNQSVGPTCDAAIQSATNAVNSYLQTPQGLQQLATDFNLCAVPKTPLDVVTFVGDLSNPIAGVVQYNDDNNLYQPYDIPVMCQLLTNGTSDYAGLQAVWNSYNQFSGQTNCTDISYTDFIASMQSTSDARSWTWQTCTEFGYFQTGDASDQPFSPLITLQSFLQQCEDIFGINGLTPRIDYINDYYGSDGIVTSNTVFTQGTTDPWHILGNYQTYDAASQSDSILIQGTAHCADMYPPRSQDLPGLVAARERQNQLLQLWLTNGNPTIKTVLSE